MVAVKLFFSMGPIYCCLILSLNNRMLWMLSFLQTDQHYDQRRLTIQITFLMAVFHQQENKQSLKQEVIFGRCLLMRIQASPEILRELRVSLNATQSGLPMVDGLHIYLMKMVSTKFTCNNQMGRVSEGNSQTTVRVGGIFGHSPQTLHTLFILTKQVQHFY